MIADLFWLSPGEQGDLSDVVRASLHPQPEPEHYYQQLPAAAASFSYLQQPEELAEGGLQLHGDHGQLGIMTDDASSKRPSSSDHKQVISPDYSLAEMIHGMSPPQRPPGMERLQEAAGDDVVPERSDRMRQHMLSMDHHPARVPAASKPRKSQTKRVVCIPAPTAASGRQSTSGEVVPSDLWAWRKYGQKPIKGSPYPRGYYRCSSSKGCPARKQVERSRTDPNMLVITYTSDHNHPWPTQRNALAGSTRLSSSASAIAAAAKNTSSSSSSSLPTAAQGPSRNSDSINNNDPAAAAAHHRQLKQEDDLDLFADMDSLNILSSITKTHEEDSKQQQQLFDPFSSCFFDCL
ncbi:probable WRKY transcription factor 29 isoform X2 [Brachypodium distachyon]|nr:probable WRKY transcription factor 29 isoform X2 [Brachypodium distachyon]KQJ97996.1 hypothetical protein BRADI_3g34567v3 [Brachypodium distachyon]KQJ97997.1 hypothetical protein BRADI_3g34567v3 [Brachypodium distachyon]|eukprot:XP_024318164.1 probable WRKY transcription factor 29 isoform X2 [Brachypodium distachyon]